MSPTLILFIIGAVHLLLCLVTYLLLRAGVLTFERALMPIVVLVPIAGFLSAVAAQLLTAAGREGTRCSTLEELHIGDDDLRLKKIAHDDTSSVIPLEEAMSVNDARTRRALMLDILRRSPDQYTELLHKACSDVDIEVSHYASTAIMELQRGYEYDVQRAEHDFRASPDDPNVCDRYIRELGIYIDSGLIGDNILFVYRRRYAEVLERKIQLEPEDMDAYLLAADNCMALGALNEAQHYSERAVTRWPGREAVWLGRLKLCEQMGDGAGIREVLRQIRSRNVYLSRHGKSVIAFWSGDGEESAGGAAETAGADAHVGASDMTSAASDNAQLGAVNGMKGES